MEKRLFFLMLSALMLAMVAPVMAQDRNNEDEVVKLDPRTSYQARPRQVIVKFRDYSTIRVSTQNRRCFATPTRGLQINNVLAEFEVDSIEQLLPDFKMPAQAHRVKSYGGGDVVETDLSQLHLITLSANSSHNEYELMEQLKVLDEVEFAEPNYIVYALGSPVGEPVSDALREKGRHEQKSTADYSPNDPMYSMQWGIPACNLHKLLAAPKINGNWRPIIAIIDTGVDIDHPDLKANIWTNTAEAAGASGADDDANGFTDDIHGWDFVNQTGDMHDFNSHGTHCAGIAAAVGNNGIGITGACPDAQIMPVAVMQSDGTGDIATIIKGINYAAQNGADVISMSIGTYAYSIALEQALAHAYQTAVLVGAAGNDHYHIQRTICKEDHCVPMFPGAFSFVLGVQATSTTPNLSEEHNGMLASFSNIDNDGGPLSSSFAENLLYNYELSAPGTGIMSTVPNGGYRQFNGTSMATPLVAGGIASLLQRRHYQTWEILWADLINYSQEFQPVDLWAAYHADSISPAVLQCITIEVNDTAYGDSSMYADAGERVQLYPTIRTVWGPCDSIYIWLEFQAFEDTNTVEILSGMVPFVWPLSSYAHSKSLNPIDIRVAPNVVDGRQIKLTLCAATTDAQDTMRHKFTLTVTNGVKLHGMIMGNYTLYPNVHYIVTNNVALPTGDTLFIKPGTTVKIKDGCSINATIMAIGKPDSMITFTKTNLGTSWLNITSSGGLFDYCIFEYHHSYHNTTKHALIGGGYSSSAKIVNSIYRYEQRFSASGNFQYVEFEKTNFFYNKYAQDKYVGNNIVSNGAKGSFCNVIGNVPRDAASYVAVGNNMGTFNNVFCNNNRAIRYDNTYVDITTPDSTYYGSSVESLIRDREIYDFETPGTSSFGWINLSKRLLRPSPLTHGIVWKVLVNGFDPQDEADSVEYLGVGSHRFDVYFNRAMDTSITPILAMGVRSPYTQTPINKNASWSADSTIYTAYLTLTGRDAIDGVNRIYVSGAQDNEHFEIPVENQRFEVQVAISGSMSAGFQATPGTGKVNLEWNDQEVNYEDFLGFNLYRYQYVQQPTNYHYDEDLGQYVYDTITVPGDTMLLNKKLIQDTVYTDFDVVPGERYYYFYKILSTSLTENSPSKTVSCVPHSTIRGDANGSYKVDIADVITTINYVTGQNPQPFLHDAADVNGDSVINVLDIVGIINIILHPEQMSLMADNEQYTAIYTVENGILYINTPVALGGLQFRLAHCAYSDIEPLAAMNGFEMVHAQLADSSLSILAYSMSGMQIPAGKTALLRIGDKSIDDIVLSDPQGHNVIALNGKASGMTDIKGVPAQIMKAFPNPFDNEVQIDFVIGQESVNNCRLVFYDVLGRAVDAANLPVSVAGKHSYRWQVKDLPAGVYFATLYVNSLKAHTVKLILK